VMGSSSSSLKTFAKAGVAGAAGAGLAVVTKQLFSSIEAAKQAQIAQAKLKQALGTAGLSYAKYGTQIDAAIQKTSKLAGLDDEELSDSFSNLVRTTGSVAKSTKGMALAANIARARNVSLETATKAVERAFAGSDLALKRYGINVPKVTDSVDKLKAKEMLLRKQMEGTQGARRAELQAQLDAIRAQKETAKSMDKSITLSRTLDVAQKKYAGSAAAYGKTAAGAQDKLAVAFENLQEKLGAKLLPVLTKVTLKLVALIEWAELNWPKFSAAASEAIAKIQPILDGLSKYFGGWVKIIKGIVQGDWSLVWKGLKQVVVGAVDTVKEYLKLVIPALARLGLRMGKALANGVIDGIGNLVDRITDKLPGFLASDEGFQKKIASAKAKVATANDTARRGGSATPRAAGGPVMPGVRYRVGERGPEDVVFGQRGMVIPNGGGRGGITINGPINLPGVQNPQQFLRELQRLANSTAASRRGTYGGQKLALG